MVLPVPVAVPVHTEQRRLVAPIPEAATIPVAVPEAVIPEAVREVAEAVTPEAEVAAAAEAEVAAVEAE